MIKVYILESLLKKIMSGITIKMEKLFEKINKNKNIKYIVKIYSKFWIEKPIFSLEDLKWGRPNGRQGRWLMI